MSMCVAMVVQGRNGLKVGYMKGVRNRSGWHDMGQQCRVELDSRGYGRFDWDEVRYDGVG